MFSPSSSSEVRNFLTTSTHATIESSTNLSLLIKASIQKVTDISTAEIRKFKSDAEFHDVLVARDSQHRRDGLRRRPPEERAGLAEVKELAMQAQKELTEVVGALNSLQTRGTLTDDETTILKNYASKLVATNGSVSWTAVMINRVIHLATPTPANSLPEENKAPTFKNS